MFLRPYFEAADEDGNQTLDVGELVTMLRSLLTDLAVPQTILSEVEASADAIWPRQGPRRAGSLVPGVCPRLHQPAHAKRYM